MSIYHVPTECQPLRRYTWVNSESLLVQLILNFKWFNWSQTSITQIKTEINSVQYLEYAPAKMGFWLRYKYRFRNTKIPVEIFVRTVKYEDEI